MIHVQMPAKWVALFPDKDPLNHIEPEHIMEIICEFYRLRRIEVVSKTRKRERVIARQVFCYMCREFTHLPMAAIGDMLGGQDHTTVIHSLKTIKDLMETDEKLLNQVVYLRNKIKYL